MNIGLKTWDASGNLSLDITDSLCKILGKLDTADYITDLNQATGDLYVKPPWIEDAIEAYRLNNTFWCFAGAVWWPAEYVKRFSYPSPSEIGVSGDSIRIPLNTSTTKYASRVVYLCGVY